MGSPYDPVERKRDHLFISYAAEDWMLAEWLTLRLTAEGYSVWCDRVKLLGGESYPRDIDKAIKQRTFRVLALLSRHSVRKPNPLKERTLALSIARDRAIDFLIPLNVDGLSPTELDWMTADLTFIPFHENWATGLGQLLKKLDSVGAPRSASDGKAMVRQWFASREPVADRPERLWTNLLQIEELPRVLLRFTLRRPVSQVWPDNWPHYAQDSQVAWAFDYPGCNLDSSSPVVVEIDWQNEPRHAGVATVDVVTNLIKQQLVSHCLRKGMSATPDTRQLYFPPGLLPNGRLTFTGYNGRKTWVRAVGERTFRVSPARRERCRYHLSPIFRPKLRAFGEPMVQVQLRVHLTDLTGTPLDAAKTLRRRKRICRDWWNREWLCRLLGVVSWLADGKESFNIAGSGSCPTIIRGVPITLSAPIGIDESALAPLRTDEEAEIPEEPLDEPDHERDTWREEANADQ